MTIDTELLRSIVRDALRDALGGATSAREMAKALSIDVEPAQVVEVVSLANDADLKLFVNRVLDMAEDPQTLSALHDGQIVFRLGHQANSQRADSATNRIDKGALTESSIRKAAGSGSTVIVGRKVIVTSLARDKARELGVTIIRESQQVNQRGLVVR
jgi:hypothetical protein